MSKRSSRRKSPSRRFRRWRRSWPVKPAPASVVKLAPGDMIDGYERLSALAVEALGKQARITCERGCYWVRVFPDLPPDCLGQVEDYAVARLADVVAHWHRYWAELADQVWRQESGAYEDEAGWLDWWESLRGGLDS